MLRKNGERKRGRERETDVLQLSEWIELPLDKREVASKKDISGLYILPSTCSLLVYIIL